MAPLLLAALGVLAVVAGLVLLRSFGPRLRVGRLLATTPPVTVAEAAELAARGERRYVRVRGRIDAEEDFEDLDHRPLVFRRTRLAARQGGAWTTFEDGREEVPFEIREGLDGIAVDAAALDAGLVVVPRVSEGTAADLDGRAPGDIGPSTPVRVTIEQVSSVEHAIVLGVPALQAGRPTLTNGLGRPLVLTTLEPPEAMRLLSQGRVGTSRAAAVLLGTGALLVAVSLGWAIVDLVL